MNGGKEEKKKISKDNRTQILLFRDRFSYMVG